MSSKRAELTRYNRFKIFSIWVSFCLRGCALFAAAVVDGKCGRVWSAVGATVACDRALFVHSE